MKKIIAAMILSVLGSPLWAVCDSTTPPTVTTRMGLSIPVINACGWGSTLNNDFAIIDASAPILNAVNVFMAANTFNAGLTVGNANTIQFNDTSTHHISLRAPNTATTTDFILPSDGSNGQFLKTDGAGTLSFATVSGGGGGGGGGTVNASTQTAIPYYSIAGSSNVLSGDYANFGYNPNTFVFHASTITTSSMTTTGPFYQLSGSELLSILPVNGPQNPIIGMTVPIVSGLTAPLDIGGFQGQGMVTISSVTLGPLVGPSIAANIGGTANAALGTASANSLGALSLRVSPTVWEGFYANGSLASTTLWKLPSSDANGFWESNGSGVLSDTSTVPFNISFTSGVLLSGSAGTNGQVLTSGGVGTVPTWTTVSGGGGTSGQVNASTQTAIPYYSIAGSSNVLSGDYANFSYNPNTETVNIATSTISSATVSGQLIVGTTLYTPIVSNYPNNSMLFQLYDGSSLVNALTLTAGGIPNETSLSFNTTSNSRTSLQGVSGMSSGNGATGDSIWVSQGFGSGLIRSAVNIQSTVGSDQYILAVDTNPSTGTYYLSVDTHGVTNVAGGLTVGGSAGTNGQLLTSGGAGAVPTWTTVSGGGGASGTINASTQTAIGYYSGTASTTTISGDYQNFSYTSSQQTVNIATATISSVTVSGQFRIGSAGTGYLQSTGNNLDYYTPASPNSQFNSRLLFSNTNTGSGQTNQRTQSGWNFEDTNANIGTIIAKGPSGSIQLNSTGTITLYDGPTLNYVAIQSSSTNVSTHTIVLPLQAATSTNSFVNVSGITGRTEQLQFFDLYDSTPTWTGQAQWTSASPSTFTLLNVSTFTASSATITNLSLTQLNGVTPGLVAGANITSITGTWPNQTINAASGGGGNGLPVWVSSGSNAYETTVSSPNYNTVYDSNTLITNLLASGTVQILVSSSAVLYTSSATATYLQQSSAALTYLYNSSATATYLSQSSATATYLQTSSATASYLTKVGNGSGLISLTAANISAGTLGTSVIASSVAVSGSGANTYGSATVVPVITFGVDGRLTSVSSATISASGGYALQPATVTIQGNQGVTASTLTVYSTVVSTQALVVQSTNNLTAFSVSNSSVTAGDYMLAISSVPGGSGTMLLGVNTYSHLVSSGTTPTPSSCGTGSPSVLGTDMAGTITTGGGSPTACTITFSNAYLNTPVCVCSPNAGVSCGVSSASASAVTFTLSVTETSINYICIGNKG